MARVIGAADDFYRVRVTRISESDEPDLEWREDILWREPPSESPSEREVWRLEAVLIDEDRAIRIADYETSEEAHSALDIAEEDLEALTKSQFEVRYLQD